MHHLMRRRDCNARQETWRIRYGDVVVATISIREGNGAGAYHRARARLKEA
jgi:hypothetical protein